MLATVTGTAPGQTDRLLAAVAARLGQEGARVLGAVRAPRTCPGGQCESTLWLLPDGPAMPITQDLGAGSTACRLDAGALEDAVGVATARLSGDGADLVILNKFGVSEAQGRGFRALIALAMASDIPVLLGLSDTHRPAFDAFAGDLSKRLAPQEDALFAWCQAAVARPKTGSVAP